MGVVSNIKHDKFPEQGNYLGRKVKVCFHYDTNNTIPGVIVRDDKEEPHRTIIKLDDGRHVLAIECQYQTTNS